MKSSYLFILSHVWFILYLLLFSFWELLFIVTLLGNVTYGLHNPSVKGREVFFFLFIYDRFLDLFLQEKTPPKRSIHPFQIFKLHLSIIHDFLSCMVRRPENGSSMEHETI